MNALKSAISHTSSTVTPSAVPSSTVEPQSQNAVRSTAPQAIAFIDAAVEGSEMLIQGMRPEVVAQRLETDALAQMTARLAQNSHVDEVHLVCHGEPGCLYLGGFQLNAERLENNAALLEQWFAPGSDAAIYLYGCQVAAGERGTAFVERLSSLTGATVFASSRKVGGLQAGGVWFLDYGTDLPQPVELFSAATRMRYAGVFAPGDLVTSFGNGGTVSIDIGGGYDLATSVAIDPAGNILVAGVAQNLLLSNSDFAIVRYNHLGQLDSSFGFGGVTTTSFSSGIDGANGLELDRNGNIFLSGIISRVDDGSGFLGLAKYNSAGQTDSSFGNSGQAPAPLVRVADGGDIAIDPSGNILVGGSDTRFSFTASRFTSDGSLDNSFGTFGTASAFVGLNSTAYSMATDAQGRVLIAGEVVDTTSFTGSDFALVRFTANGDRDSSFGDNGVIKLDFSRNNDRAVAVTTNEAGDILVAGTSASSDRTSFALARYRSDGILDQSFGDGGKVVTNFGDSDAQASSIALDGAGNILVGGYAIDNNNSDFAIARYRSNGSLDRRFGQNGRATYDFGGAEEVINDLAISPAGEIFVSGANTTASSNLEDLFAENFFLFQVEGDRSTPAPSDFNNDGQSDLLLYYPEEQFSGIGYVVGSGFPELSSLWTGWKPTGRGDFNQDGQTDIVVKNEDNGWNGILYMQGNTVQYSQGIAGWDDWEVIGVGNFNGDGTPDLMVRHQSQPWYGTLYMGGGDGNLVIASQGINVWEGWDVKATGDFNNDGRAELVVQNQTEDWFGILYLDANQQIVSSQGIVGWADWNIIGASDINSDGQVDLLIEHQSQPWNGAWHMDGNQIVSSQGLSTPAGWEITA